MGPKIGMICSSLKLAEKAKRAANERGVHIEIKIGTLERAIPIGKGLEAKGIEVIICPRGKATVLKENLSIPVIPIPFSTFDLLGDISEAAKYGKNIGISIYGKHLLGTEILEHLLQIKIKQIIFHDPESLRAGILQAKNEGMEVYLGGNFAFETCQKIGIPCVLFTSSEESIACAIDEGRVAASIRREEREKTRRIEAILNSVSEGMVAIDEKGMVTVFNKVAEEFLGMKAILGTHIDSVIPQLGICEVLRTGTSKLQCLQRIGEVQIVANLVPIYFEEKVIGAIASFTDVSKVMQAEQKVRKLYAKGFVTKHTVGNIVCESPPMKQVIGQIRQFAQSDSTVLITGESGTGKELVAHSIHNLSPRNKGGFVTINCSALPENLLESEIFGYEEGSFTGARKGGKMGLFELAHKGTIFLDEIGSISEGFQARLLRVFQQKEVMRIGGDRIIPVDVRIIAATNKDLLKAIKEGRMRMDLYFRLNILRIHIPPLRERKEDISILVPSIIDTYARKYGRKMEPLPERVIKRFLDYSWPGNIRELENFIEKFILIVERPAQYEEVLNILFEECLKTEKVLFGDDTSGISFSDNDLKKMVIEPSLKREEIAKMMGISRTTLWRRLRSIEPMQQ